MTHFRVAALALCLALPAQAQTGLEKLPEIQGADESQAFVDYSKCIGQCGLDAASCRRSALPTKPGVGVLGKMQSELLICNVKLGNCLEACDVTFDAAF